MKPEREAREHILAKSAEKEGLRAHRRGRQGHGGGGIRYPLPGGLPPGGAQRERHSDPHDPAAVERAQAGSSCRPPQPANTPFPSTIGSVSAAAGRAIATGARERRHRVLPCHAQAGAQGRLSQDEPEAPGPLRRRVRGPSLNVRELDVVDQVGLVRRMPDKRLRCVDLMADNGCRARRSRPMGPILAVILCLAGGAAAADEFRDEMMGHVIRPCFLAWIDHYAGADQPAHLKDEEIDKAIAEHAGMVEAWIKNAREFT